MDSTIAGSGNRGNDTLPDDARIALLRGWVSPLLANAPHEITTASADASFRRYFRVTTGNDTRIVMDAPPDKEDVGPFIRIAAMLEAVGVNAPRVIGRDLRQGFLLLTDLGRRTYLADLEQDVATDVLYADAIVALVRIQSRGSAHAEQLPPYDEPLLRREMQLFPDWFLGRHLGLALDATANAILDRTFALLAAEAIKQPRVFVHRDYHSRNLMVCGGPLGANPGILDFQDAVNGPITYDLVSLLRDCYVAWPARRVHGWLEDYRRQATAAGLDVAADAAVFNRWFDWMGMQRHFKAIGIFARLWHRDGKPGYLNDIPRTYAYVEDVAARYTEFTELKALLDSTISPALARTRLDPQR